MLADADYAGRAVEPPRMDASLRMVPSLVIAHLQKHVGRKQAYQMLVTAEPCQADAALMRGLVNRLRWWPLQKRRQSVNAGNHPSLILVAASYYRVWL